MLDKLQKIYIDAKKEYEKEKKYVINNAEVSNKNQIVIGDNYEYFLKFLQNQRKVDLIYMDPPFFSMSNYNSTVKTTKLKSSDREVSIKVESYKDSWRNDRGLEGYIKEIIKILLLTKDILSEQGVLWIHLDWHAVHYIKIFGDEIFGMDNFINEIIWTYKSGGAGGNRFSRKHDTLLVYSKNKKRKLSIPKEKSYNRAFKQYKFEGVEEFQDHIGWYTLVNMKDVWQIDMVGRTSKERNGYATQKPQELLRRVVESSSKKGDLCADFYGGSGAFAIACNSLGREFISCDKNPLAASLLEKYALKNNIPYEMVISQKKEKESVPSLKNSCISISKNDEKIEISNYIFDPESMKSMPKDIEKFNEILVKKPLSLISYYKVIEDGKERVILPNKEGVLDLVFKIKEGNTGTILVVDIFGNREKVEL